MSCNLSHAGRTFLCVVLLVTCPGMFTMESEAAEPSHCTPDPPTRWFVGLGQMQIDREGLNLSLDEAGYGQFRQGHRAISFVIYTRTRGRWVIGGSTGYSCQTVGGPGGSYLEASACANPWNAQLGYVVLDYRTLTCFPYVGLGIMAQTLEVVRDRAVDFDDQLRYPAGESEFTSVCWTWSAGIHLDNLIVLKASGGRSSGLTLGVRAEYLRSLTSNHWTTFDRSVHGAPSVARSSWSIRFLLGWGSQATTGETN